MARYRSFLFPEASIEADSLTLDARESHHLVRVFRAKVGETVEVLDGKGQHYFGRIIMADARAVRIAVDSIETSPRSQPSVTLLQSIPKGKTMDLILRLATEIGVSRVQPVFTDQGDVQIKGERQLSKVEKWQITMIEACKQCGLSYLPKLSPPITLRNWLEMDEEDADELRIVASLEPGSVSLVSVLEAHRSVRSVVVAVGPEGDFSEQEYAALKADGFQAVRLGANVLRSETAAAYILSVVDQCLAPSV